MPRAASLGDDPGIFWNYPNSIPIGAYFPWRGAIWVAIGISLGVLVLFAVIVVALEGPSNCQICGNQLTRNKYTWRLDGGKKVVCAECNARLRRKASKEAMTDL